MLSPKIERLTRSFFDSLRPDPPMSVSDWADRFRYLSQRSAAEPGRWRTARTPYLREPMDCLSPDSPFEEVVLIKGAQIGGTECGNNFLGYVIDRAPGPVLYVLPGQQLAKRTSRQRIAPLIEESPQLRGKVKDARSRDSGNTVLMKDFDGGVLVLASAKSAADLRSLPAKYLILDELDAYPPDVEGEGSPVSLAEARQRTFARKKRLKISTPTFEGRSNIKAAWLASDMRRYHVPCPHCGHFQHLRWERIAWEKNQPETATYLCEACEARIEEYHKTEMLERGVWIAESPGASNGKIAGFHISSLYSPLGWYSWADAVRDFIKAKDTPEKLRAFVNTVLGETWREKGEAPEWQRLYDRREKYQIGRVPAPVLLITAGADVQKDRIEVELYGWTKDLQSYSIEKFLIQGDTSTDAPFLELDKLLEATWPHELGLAIPIRMLAIDSGFNTQTVYRWARKHPPQRVMVVKGTDSNTAALLHPTDVEVMVSGKRLRRGLKLWPISVSILKSEFYSWAQIPAPVDGEEYPPRFCHFPEYDSDHFKQLCSEQIVVRIIRGVRRYIWEKIQDRNEALDMRIYARAAAIRLGVDRWSDADWESIRRELMPAADRPSDPSRRRPAPEPRPTDDFWRGR